MYLGTVGNLGYSIYSSTKLRTFIDGVATPRNKGHDEGPTQKRHY